jgi:LacI family transcriptional regulator, galactose operon repressor
LYAVSTEPAPGRRSASITDVAKAVGISPTTVSHALSGRRPVREETVRAIHRAMDELGYVPNHAARSLRVGSTQAIGLLVPDVSNPFYADLARGVEDVAESQGFNVLLCNTNFERSREQRYARVFRSGVVDGLIYAAATEVGGYGSERLARDLPVVVVNEAPRDTALDTVNTDNERGGELAGEHLLGLGHTSVLVIDGPPGSPTSEPRRSGFERAFAGNDVTLGHRCGDYRAPSAARIIRREIGERGLWFSAVYAANDVMAVAAMAELRACGITVPDDVSVVGYDDSPLAELVTPALTTIRQPVYEMGRVGAERLLATIGGSCPVEQLHIKLDVELVRRTSTDRRR